MSLVHTQILPPTSVDESKLTYVVIAARENGLWVFVRHKERLSWEMPAGHIEAGETAVEAAGRELQEETGAIKSSLKHLCDYQVTIEGTTEAGRLYGAEILIRESFLEYEIAEVRLSAGLPSSLTYPEVQSMLFEHAKELLRS